MSMYSSIFVHFSFQYTTTTAIPANPIKVAKLRFKKDLLYEFIKISLSAFISLYLPLFSLFLSLFVCQA